MIIAAMMLTLAAAQSAQAEANAQAGLQAEIKLCDTGGIDPGLEQVINACTKLLDSKTLNPRQTGIVYQRRARAEAQSEDYATANADIAAGLGVVGAPADVKADLFLLRAQIKATRGEMPAARADLDLALQQVPGQVDALLTRARLSINDKRYADARRDLDGALVPTTTPPAFRAAVYKYRGILRRLEKDWPGARADFEQGLLLSPNSADILQQRGLLAEDEGRYDAALADFEQVMKLAPKSSMGFNSACWVLAAYLKRDFERARGLCDTALALAPKDDAILDSVGLVALQQQRWQDAWKAYDAAIAIVPDYPSALHGRGIAALRLGRTAAGDADILKATKLNPAIGGKYSGYGQKP